VQVVTSKMREEEDKPCSNDGEELKNKVGIDEPCLLRIITDDPTYQPTSAPLLNVSVSPSSSSAAPSTKQSLEPSATPSLVPSDKPSTPPSYGVSLSPSAAPSLSSSEKPSLTPSTTLPTYEPTLVPTISIAPSGLRVVEHKENKIIVEPGTPDRATGLYSLGIGIAAFIVLWSLVMLKYMKKKSNNGVEKHQDNEQPDNEPDNDLIAPAVETAAAQVTMQSPVTVDETKAYWCGCTPVDLP
jgi:hypothetical protein